MIGRLLRMLTVALRRRRFERRMADEMASHMAHREDDLEAGGLPPEAAQRQAQLEFGRVEFFKDSCRDARRLDLGDELVRNLRNAMRIFARAPAMTLAILGTLGLGIGANVAVFSVVDAVLLRPLPYPNPDRLAIVEAQVGSEGEVQRRVLTQSGRVWEALKPTVKTLDLAAFTNWPAGANAAVGTRVELLDLQRVGAGFFRVLGKAPLLGREFSAQEDSPHGPAVAVLSYGVWQRLFQGDPEVLGRGFLLRGELHEIIGVMPADFQSTLEAEVWTPLRPSTSGEGEGNNYRIIGRLQPDASWPAAEAEVRAAGASVLATMRSPEGTDRWLGLEPMQRGITRDLRYRLLISWGVAWLVLIVACINVAGLLFAHASGRGHEMVTRMALGAGRAAIFRQLVTESLLLSSLGGALGLLTGAIGIRLLHGATSSLLGLWQEIELSGRSVAIAAGLAALSILLSGLYPALRISRRDLRPARGDVRVAGSGKPRYRQGLVVVQFAVVVSLLTGASLLVQTLDHLRGLDPGFDPEGVVAATVSLQDSRYVTPAQASRLLEEVAEGLRNEPGIAAAAAGLALPYERPLNLGFAIPGEGERRIANLSYVTPTYFETLRIALLRGRLLGAMDRLGSAPAAVVNAAFVNTYLKDRNPIGLRISTAGGEREIVGVVADTQQTPGWGADEPLGRRATIYVPLGQTSADFLRLIHVWFQPSWVVRASTGRNALERTLRGAVAAVDPQLPLAKIRSMAAVRDEALSQERFQATLMAAGAVIALVLAVLGLGSLISASVTDRRRELGVRMALGATLRGTVRSAAAPGIAMASAGLALGLLLSLGVGRWLRAFVYGVDIFHFETYAEVAAVLFVVAAASSLLPALRVARIDPAQALRPE